MKSIQKWAHGQSRATFFVRFFLILCTLVSNLAAVSLPGNILFSARSSQSLISFQSQNATAMGSGPLIHNITTNLDSYINGTVPKYEKFEISFQVDTTAANLQFPYDSNPPPGITTGAGISVDAFFSKDNWLSSYQQPAFYYQDFQNSVKNGNAWFYPTGVYVWKVRFAPPTEGNWEYKIRAHDASGISETQEMNFSVGNSSSNGFIRVSQSDSRYFQYDDGKFFQGLGYNMNYDQVRWDNPIGSITDKNSNAYNFDQMSKNGIQLIRIWLSEWSIYGSMWGQWKSMTDGNNDGLTTQASFPGHEVSMLLSYPSNPSMFLGWLKAAPPVKPATKYHLSVRYMIPQDLIGPRNAASPNYGLVAKFGGWINNPWDSNTGEVITTYKTKSPKNASGDPQWSLLEADFTTKPDQYFLDYFYLALENINAGTAPAGGGLYNAAVIDQVVISEDLGNGQYGPNIISKPLMDEHTYFDQKYSFSFDNLLDLAHQKDIYFRLVVLEKSDWIFDRIQYDGTINQSLASNDNFYGDWRTMTRMRWYQQAWWRYLQARWGYSTNIMAWELLNEGDPYSGLHYTLADEFGKYMHCQVFGITVGSGNGDKCSFEHPNSHLVSTSFWHSFPSNFWGNPDYPNIDFADVHQYIFKNQAFDLRVDNPMDGSAIHISDGQDFYDSAAVTQKLSLQIGAKEAYGVNKPTIRGETGFVDGSSDGWVCDLLADNNGIWLHNFVWGGTNSGGLYDSGNWYPGNHIYANNMVAPNCANPGPYNFDHRSVYGTYFRFMSDIPLSNGHYVDAAATFSNTNLRVWGQKDVSGGQAFLWIANRNHTWKNVVDNVTISPISDTITIPGFQPGKKYTVQWWDTYQTDPAKQILKTETIVSKANGDITLSISNLSSDTAVKVFTQSMIFIPFVRNR